MRSSCTASDGEVEDYVFTINSPADQPFTVGHEINGGQSQRNGITSITIQFDQPVSVASAGALTLHNNTNPGFNVDLSDVSISGNGTNRITWDLSTTALADGSSEAADGVYTATLLATEVLSTSTNAAMNANAQFNLHRLLGDANGDRTVGNADAFVWINHRSDPDGPPFSPGDFNGDGIHGNADAFTWINTRGNELPEDNAPSAPPATYAEPAMLQRTPSTTLAPLPSTMRALAADGIFAGLSAGDDDAGMADVETLESALVDISTFRRNRSRSM